MAMGAPVPGIETHMLDSQSALADRCWSPACTASITFGSSTLEGHQTSQSGGCLLVSCPEPHDLTWDGKPTTKECIEPTEAVSPTLS